MWQEEIKEQMSL